MDRGILSVKRTKVLALIAITCVFAFLFRKALSGTATLILGACVITFIAHPLCALFEKKLPRSVAALLALAAIALIVILCIWLIVPVIIREGAELVRLLPRSFEKIRSGLGRFSGWLDGSCEAVLPAFGVSRESAGELANLASGTIALAGNIAEFAGRASLMVVLSYFFLCDRDALLLRLELVVPSKHRALAVRMGNAVVRELRMYLRGQFTVAACVGLLAAFGLFIIGVRSAVVLGPVIGLLNMIPYFGPFIGGVPAVLAALADGWQKAALTLAVVFIVQQLDNSFISPRIMGNLTGLSPALVLITIFAGAQLAGVVGMLFALPVIMTFRTLFRVFVQRHENI